MIPLNQIYVTVPIQKSLMKFRIDLPIYNNIKNYKWYLSSTGHAYTWFSSGIVYIHRFVTHCPEDLTVDHINNWKLDCRKENLRICTQRQNLQHKSPKKDSNSKFKGVSIKKSLNRGFRFIAKIKHEDKRIHLGTFSKETDAALEYNKYAKIFFGQYAYLNPIMTYFDSVTKMKYNI